MALVHGGNKLVEVIPRSVNAMCVKVISPGSKSQGIKVVMRKC